MKEACPCGNSITASKYGPKNKSRRSNPLCNTSQTGSCPFLVAPSPNLHLSSTTKSHHGRNCCLSKSDMKSEWWGSRLLTIINYIAPIKAAVFESSTFSASDPNLCDRQVFHDLQSHCLAACTNAGMFQRMPILISATYPDY